MKILNRKKMNQKWPNNSVYVGRGTPLGNPYAIGPDGSRDEVIDKFAYDLDRKIDNEDPETINALRSLNQDSNLVCSCAPERCHVEIIIDRWEKRIKGKYKPLVFVFGSNLAGRHGKGAALAAVKEYGAIYGQGTGLQNNAYAIPTKDHRIQTMRLDYIAGHIREFLRFAEQNPNLEFIVTPIGTGLAGYPVELIAPMFHFAPSNCLLPEGWSQTFRNTETRILITGSRGISESNFDPEKLNKIIAGLLQRSSSACILASDLAGAGEIGRHWAQNNKTSCILYPTLWGNIDVPHAVVKTNKNGEYNARAAFENNMLMAVGATHIILLWDGQSKETPAIELFAEKNNIPKRVIMV